MHIKWNMNTPSWIAMYLLQQARVALVTERGYSRYSELLDRAINYVIRTGDDDSIVFVD